MAARNVRRIGGSKNVKPIPVTHFIPPKSNPIYKLELVSSTETIDVTNKLVEGEFTDGVTSTIGNFTFRILDPSNNFSGRIDEYDTVNLYLDYGATATTLRFSGKIERKSNVDYVYLELSGRSVALTTTGVNVTYNSDGQKARSTILTEIIEKYFSGVITTGGIETDSGTIQANYSEVPFWDVVEALCSSGGRDAYISPSLEMNYFLIGSRRSTTEAVVEDRNLINPFDFAKDTEEVVTKVKIYGKKINNIPVLATSDSDTTVTKGITKERKIDNANLLDEVQAKAVADWEFEQNKVLPTLGGVISLMLPTIAPGQKIKMVSPSNNIPPEYYEVSSYSHKFSEKGVPVTVVNIKKPRLNIPEIIKKNIVFQTAIVEGDNPNEMEFSLITDFNTDSTGDKSDVQITDGVLKTTEGNTTGTWTSTLKVLDEVATAIEPRITGNNLAGVQVFVSMNGGTTFTQVAGPNTTSQKIVTGKNVKLRVVLNSSTAQVSSVGLLYKIS